jgi:hypothetical protein
MKCQFWKILTKIGMCRQILLKISNIKFHETPFDGSRCLPFGLTDRPADVTRLTVSIRSCFAKAPKTGNVLLTVHHKTSYTTRNTKINQERPVSKNKVTGSAKQLFEPELNLCCHYIQIGRQTNIHVLVQ